MILSARSDFASLIISHGIAMPANIQHITVECKAVIQDYAEKCAAKRLMIKIIRETTEEAHLLRVLRRNHRRVVVRKAHSGQQKKQ